MTARRFLTRTEAASYLGYSPRTLANLASLGNGPRFTKPAATKRGAKTLYDIADLDSWVTGGQHLSTPARTQA